MKLCKTCVYGTEYELDKPCIVYRADCRYYRKRGESMTIDKTETFVEHDIVVDGTKVGAVELCPERNEISRLEIFEPYQNKGYGTEVVRSLVEQGYTSLWVRSDNPRAIHVYESCGFKRGKVQMFEMTTTAIEQEPSGDLISRDDTLTAFADYVGSGMSMNDYDALWDIVAKMPPVKQEPGAGVMLICPDCGLEVHSDFKTCPRCGAKMAESR